MTINEIGSEFWINNLHEKGVNSEKRKLLFLDATFRLLSSARGAISLILEKEAQRFNNKKVLLPAYICDSVIQPFLDKGFECLFYDVDTHLQPDPESFELASRKNPGLLIHLGYFGFNSSQNLKPLLQNLSEKGTFIIEDETHTMLSHFEKFKGNDRSFGSIRKWLGVPCGAYVSSYNNDSNQFPKNVAQKYVDLRTEAMQLKGRYLINPNEVLKKRYLKIFAQAQEVLEKDTNYYDIDPLSESILYSSDYGGIIERRRENYKFLLENLNGIDTIQIPFPVLPDNVTPLFFPILVKGNRDRLRTFLTQHQVYCPIHWPKPGLLKKIQPLKSDNIYENILSIPIDQRYNKQHMTRIVDLVRKHLSF